MIEILKYLDVLFNQIWTFTQKYESLTGTIIGAFLAALFGIFTQKYNNHSERKNQIKRYGRILFHDFENIYHILTALRITFEHDKQNGTFDKNKIFQLAKERHWFNYNSQWREYLLEISDKIPDSSYKRIVDIYNSIFKIDIALSSQSVDIFFDLIDNLFLYDVFKERSGISLTTNYDIFHVLRSISKKGAIQGKWFNDFIEKAFGQYLFLRFSKKINYVVILWLKKEKRIDTEKLIKKIEEWLNSQKYFTYRLVYKSSIKNVIYRSLKNSKVIQFSWKECILNENKSKNANNNLKLNKKGSAKRDFT